MYTGLIISHAKERKKENGGAKEKSKISVLCVCLLMSETR